MEDGGICRPGAFPIFYQAHRAARNMRRRRRVLRLALVLAVTVCGAVHAAASVPDEALDMAPDESPDESSICQHWRDSLAQNDAAAFPWIRVDDQSALPVNIPWTHSSSPHVVSSAARSLSPPLEEGTPFPVDSIHARDRIEFAVVVVQRRQWWRSSSTDVQLSLSSAVSLGSTDDDDDDKVKHVTYFSRMARGRRFLPRRKPVGDGWLATGEPQVGLACTKRPCTKHPSMTLLSRLPSPADPCHADFPVPRYQIHALSLSRRHAGRDWRDHALPFVHSTITLLGFDDFKSHTDTDIPKRTIQVTRGMAPVSLLPADTCTSPEYLYTHTKRPFQTAAP